MNRILNYLPELQGEEINMVDHFTKDLSDDELSIFSNMYRTRRRDTQTVLIMCIIGLFVIPGLQRFYLEQIGMGILYLFTAGLCFIGSILDLVNHKKLALEYNQRAVSQVIQMIRR